MSEDKKSTQFNPVSNSRITMVKTVSPIQFLGVSGSQLAASQGAGLVFRKTTEGILVSQPGSRKAYLIYAANIAHVEYTAEDES